MVTFQRILIVIIFLLILGGIAFYFLAKSEKEKFSQEQPLLKLGGQGMMKLSSPVFENNYFIPKKYTCDGENINPALEIQGVPEEAKSLVLIVDDPDAPRGTFLHWLVWNIKPDITLIEENSAPEEAIQGRNGFGEKIYGGPCPPFGTHRYFFRAYALDTMLNIPADASREEVESVMEGHILDQAELMGKYAR